MPKQKTNPKQDVNKKKMNRQRRRQPKNKGFKAFRNTAQYYNQVQFPPECAWRETISQINGAQTLPKTRGPGLRNRYNKSQLTHESTVKCTPTDSVKFTTNIVHSRQASQKLVNIELASKNQTKMLKPRANNVKGVNKKKVNRRRQRQTKNVKTEAILLLNEPVQRQLINESLVGVSQLWQHGEISQQTAITATGARNSSEGNTTITSNAFQKCNIQRPKDFAKMPPELQEDPGMWKYWKKRKYLFSKYDEGIRLDKESWYSVTPEPIARRIAERRRYNLILDAFCGAGGNTIQFANTCGGKVLAYDIDPNKIEMAKHNSTIYGVEDKIEFIEGDFFKLAKQAPFLRADMVFLSPPWGGPNYVKDQPFDIETLEPRPASELMTFARKLSSSITLYLPRNSNRDQIQSLAGENDIVEIEEMMGGPTAQGKSFQALTVYYTFCDNPVPPQSDV